MKEMEEFIYLSQLSRMFPGLENTLICAYSQVEDFHYFATKMPFYNRPTITANSAIPHNTVFYVDEIGVAHKFIIPRGSIE